MENISEKIVANLPAPETGNKLHYFSGATLQGKEAPGGFAVRVTAAGTKSFVWFHRDRTTGKPYWETLGKWEGCGGPLTVRDAIVKCRDRATAIAKGVDKKGQDVDPRPARTRRLQDGDRPAGETVSGLLDKFIERYAKKEAKLRSADQIEDTFERLVKPSIGKNGIYALRRKDVGDMLDEIADESGPVMADRTLAYVRKAFNWWMVKDENFKSPIIKGMAKTNPKKRRRKRFLADDEIRDVWAGLATIEDPACYAPFVKSLLLNATRRTEMSKMNSAELDGDLWTIPGDRYKTGLDHVIPLSGEALALIGDKPADVKKNAWFIFSTTNGAKPFSGFSKAKRELDKAIADIREQAGRAPMENWTLHDLRRTARTLISRAGVSEDHAECVVGHVQDDMRDTYNRYDFLKEKRDALEKLAALVSRILNPTANVEELATRRGQG